MKLKTALIISFGFLAACSMRQDPLSGAPEVVRQGVPPNIDRPASTQPLPKEALQIDAPSLVNGRVGVPLEFKVSGRIMMPNVSFKLAIENLNDFPGASFDQSTGEFKWIPSKAMMGSSLSLEVPLRISLITDVTPENPTISMEKRTIMLVVVNNYSKPIMNTITSNDPLTTGLRYTLPFQLEDIDALGAKDVTINIRDCTSTYGSASIAHMVVIRNIDADVTAGPNKYKGDAVIDLTAAEYLRSGVYCFALVAVSKFGVASDLYKKEVYIELKMKATKITALNGPVIKVGEKAIFSFSVYDPSGAGSLKIKAMDDIGKLLPGSTMSCVPSGYSRGQLDCEGVIDATSATEKTYYFNMTVDNSGSRPSQTTTTSHGIRITVKAATP